MRAINVLDSHFHGNDRERMTELNRQARRLSYGCLVKVLSYKGPIAIYNPAVSIGNPLFIIFGIDYLYFNFVI